MLRGMMVQGWTRRRCRAVQLSRITVDPDVCAGKACIRGLRFPVSRLLGLLAAGETRETVLQAYPYLDAEDVDEALRYAVALVEGEDVEVSTRRVKGA